MADSKTGSGGVGIGTAAESPAGSGSVVDI